MAAIALLFAAYFGPEFVQSVLVKLTLLLNFSRLSCYFWQFDDIEGLLMLRTMLLVAG